MGRGLGHSPCCDGEGDYGGGVGEAGVAWTDWEGGVMFLGFAWGSALSFMARVLVKGNGWDGVGGGVKRGWLMVGVCLSCSECFLFLSQIPRSL